MKKQAGWIILYIGLKLGIAIQDVELSWFEAQSHCRDLRSRLDYKREYKSYYWAPYFKRFSTWIGIIGCYGDSAINTSHSIGMLAPSVGLCQELCLERNLLIFAIKGKKCVCIQSNFIPNVRPLQQGRCNFNCSSYIDTMTFYECGGNNSYNVYFTGNTSLINKETKDSMCMALQCGDSKFLTRDCSLAHQSLCRNGNLAEGVATQWRTSMDRCKSSSLSSYLLGNFKLWDARSECNRLNQTVLGPTWIGVAKQIYTSYDRAFNSINPDELEITDTTESVTSVSYLDVSLTIDHGSQLITKVYYKQEDLSFSIVNFPHLCQVIKKEVIVECLKCNQKDCPFTADCTGKEKYNCVEILAATTKSQSANITRSFRDSSTEFVTKIPGIGSDTTSIFIWTKQKETETRLNAIISISVILPILLVSAVIVFIVRRRRHNRRGDVEIKQSHEDDTNTYSQVEKTRNKNHLQLEAQPRNSKDAKDLKQQKLKNLSNDKEEGVYDHHGETDSGKKAEEDTYDHTGFVVGSGECDYDTTQSIKRQEQESTYDHVGIINSDSCITEYDYGYNDPKESSNKAATGKRRADDS